MTKATGGRPKGPRTIYSGAANKRPRERGQLHEWLKQHGLSRDSFAKLIGCNGKTLDFWCDGQSIPTLHYAFMIEMVTEGSVGVETWLGTTMGKMIWEETRKRAEVKSK